MIKKIFWGQLGNSSIDDDAFIGLLSDNTIDLLVKSEVLDKDIVFSVNSTLGGQQIVAKFDANNTVAGGPAFDLRPGSSVFLPDFIFLQNTMKLVAIESGTASQIFWKLNNDQGASLRLFSFGTDNAGFGSYSFILGKTGVDNTFIINGDFDYLFQQLGLDKKIIFQVNDGGSQFNLLELDANGITNIPQIRMNGVVSILGGTINYSGSPFNVLEVGGIIEGMNVAQPLNNLVLADTTVKYTVPLTSIFGATNSINSTVRLTPDGLGAGNDNHSLRGALIAGFFTEGGSRILAAVQGAFLQGGVITSGTVTTAVGLTAQAGTALGGTITNAISILSPAPSVFLGGTIVNAVSHRIIGGTQGSSSNWSLQVQNSSVPSYFEGKVSIGHNNDPNFGLDINAFRMRGTLYMHMGGTGLSDATVRWQSPSQGFIGFSGVNGTNNENFSIDMETIANEVRLFSTSGAGLHLDFGIKRFIEISGNNLQKGGTAPTSVLIGTTPSVPALLFDAIAEIASVNFEIPSDYHSGNILIHLSWALNAVENDLDEADFTIDYVAMSTGDNLTKTSTQITGTTAVTTAQGLAQYDTYTTTLTMIAGDANNPISRLDKVSFEMHLTNIAEVSAINLINVSIEYLAKH